MGILLFLLTTEVLSLIVLRQHLSVKNKGLYYVSVVIHLIMSLWLWRLFFEITNDKGFFDTPRHIWLLLNMAGMITAVVIPRTILILFHFTGRLIRIKSREYLHWLTTTGMIISTLIFLIISSGTLLGRFNFKTEHISIKIKNLNKDLEGVKIVQLSDLHLACFYKHKELLQKVMEEVDSIKPDLILNTGDFVSYGWREFDGNDTILSKAKSRYGNFAVLGNHDFGTYHPFFTEADKRDNVLILNNLIKSSGYTVLTDTNTIVRIKNAKIGLIGIYTRGRHPNITHGDLKKAMTGLDSTDLKILLSHDPNQWEEEVASKTDIDITLSGHTHGMQMGIFTNRFKWSPSKYFYPHWGGLFIKGNQVQYVNRGLGILAIPFRIWMPPEITVITLRSE
jgi:uncharacterized protein